MFPASDIFINAPLRRGDGGAADISAPAKRQRTGAVQDAWRNSILDCGDTSPLSNDATCRVVSKRGLVRALQIGTLPVIVLFIAGALSPLAQAATTIDPANRYAYAANAGWLDAYADGSHGAVIGQFVCSGNLYSANAGWINLGSGSPANGIYYQNNSSSDFGVNRDGLGNLRGCAYGANIGWIKFEDTGAPKVNLASGIFSGYAWSANVGWISLSNAVAYVQTDSIQPGVDSNGDGIPDAWELLYFGTINIDTNADANGNGISNLREYLDGSNPLQPGDYLQAVASTIDAADKYAYGANIGWVDLRGDATNGAVIGQFICSGYIYSANTGWIKLGSGFPTNGIYYQNLSVSDFGVNQDGHGNLRGFAYGANIGWIHFEDTGAPKVDLTTGNLSGYVWSANCGWISLSNAVAYVKSDTIQPGVDSNGDGIPDAWELLHFGRINIDVNADPDHDGRSNLQEYFAGTDPNNPGDYVQSTATTIDAAGKYIYGANIGWTDWRGDTNHGAVIGQYVCLGFIYSANAGWIKLGNGSPINGVQYQNNSANDFGVNLDGPGNLRGYAWGANVGWINFEDTGAPKVDLATGNLSGYVWSANCGWISLSNAVAYVQTDTIFAGALDSNGLPMAWELQNFGRTGVDPDADPDGDGMSNKQEYLAGTDPNDANDNLRITAVTHGTLAPAYTALQWTAKPTRFYAIQQRNALDAGSVWTDLFVLPDAGAGNAGFEDATNQNFYRIRAFRPLTP